MNTKSRMDVNHLSVEDYHVPVIEYNGCWPSDSNEACNMNVTSNMVTHSAAVDVDCKVLPCSAFQYFLHKTLSSLPPQLRAYEQNIFINMRNSGIRNSRLPVTNTSCIQGTQSPSSESFLINHFIGDFSDRISKAGFDIEEKCATGACDFQKTNNFKSESSSLMVHTYQEGRDQLNASTASTFKKFESNQGGQSRFRFMIPEDNRIIAPREQQRNVNNVTDKLSETAIRFDGLEYYAENTEHINNGKRTNVSSGQKGYQCHAVEKNNQVLYNMDIDYGYTSPKVEQNDSVYDTSRDSYVKFISATDALMKEISYEESNTRTNLERDKGPELIPLQKYGLDSSEISQSFLPHENVEPFRVSNVFPSPFYSYDTDDRLHYLSTTNRDQWTLEKQNCGIKQSSANKLLTKGNKKAFTTRPCSTDSAIKGNFSRQFKQKPFRKTIGYRYLAKHSKYQSSHFIIPKTVQHSSYSKSMGESREEISRMFWADKMFINKKYYDEAKPSSIHRSLEEYLSTTDHRRVQMTTEYPRLTSNLRMHNISTTDSQGSARETVINRLNDGRKHFQEFFSDYTTSSRRKQIHPKRSARLRDPSFRGFIFAVQTRLLHSRLSLVLTPCLSLKLRKFKHRLHQIDQKCDSSDGQCCSDTESVTNSNVLISSNLDLGKQCASCGTLKTPLWRDAEDGTPLCNACGIRYKKYKIRCTRCWNIPKKDSKTYPRCSFCGSALRYALVKRMIV